MILLKKSVFENFHTYLFDAAGVIYTDNGILPKMPDVIRQCQKTSSVFLVTNNSYMYPTFIAEKLNKKDIHFQLDHIISSGAINYDTQLSNLLRDQIVYVLGEKTSFPYFIDAGCKSITKQLDDASVIILAAFLKNYSETILSEIIDHANAYPEKPIICCNPDRYVVGKDGPYPVVGLYAEKIEKAINRPLIWFGKPHLNFSQVVQLRLSQHNIKLDKGVVFCDDNIENVVNMQQHLKITGCWVKGSGIGQYRDENELKSLYGEPDYEVDSIGQLYA